VVQWCNLPKEDERSELRSKLDAQDENPVERTIARDRETLRHWLETAASVFFPPTMCRCREGATS
jgi:hypothetical protein